jgi:hypothetical protein
MALDTSLSPPLTGDAPPLKELIHASCTKSEHPSSFNQLASNLKVADPDAHGETSEPLVDGQSVLGLYW